MEGSERELRLQKRRLRVQKRMQGTPERPRLSVHRSHKNLYAQLIDDLSQKTLFGFSTLGNEFRKVPSEGTGVERAKQLGKIYGPILKKKGIEKIVFDRGGYPYHGQVRALAEALRESGIRF